MTMIDGNREDVEVKSDGFDPLDALRGDLATKVKDRFPEGTVIRWKSADRYLYAALKAAGKWWLTGPARYYGASVFDYEGLVEILGRSEVTDISVALDNWKALA